ncbi:MAG: lipopolysaccharide heptosyltransferase II [Candidatus Omnitrophota bacterium]
MNKNIEEQKRIVVFNVNWLGDVLFSTPALKALRMANPNAFLAVIVHPRTKEILENNPNIDELIVFDERQKGSRLLGKLKFVSSLRKRNFDTVYLFHRSFTRSMLMALAKIPNRIGYKAKKRTALMLTKRIVLPKQNLHRVDYFLNILKNCGINCPTNEYEFFLDSASRKKIAKFLEDQLITPTDFVVILNPGGNWDLKRWSPQQFSQLADELISEFKAKIILTGSAKDLSLARQIASGIKEKSIITCGNTSLKELGALIERGKLFISADSGPMHISVALGIPTIALFGPTSPEITGPIGRGKFKVVRKDIGCLVPCYNVKCKDNRCMQSISVEDVLGAVREITSL